MFTVQNCGHQHSTVYEAKVCIGLIRPAAPPRPAPVKPYSPPPVPYKDQPGTMTSSQESYLKSLGATHRHLVTAQGARLSMNQASKLIDDFKEGRVRVESQPEDTRLKMIEGMFDLVPNGYFAVRVEEGAPITFMRVSQPKTGRFKGCRKVQTQHGDRLELAAAKWPSGKWSVYRNSIVDSMMLLVADYRGAALLYAQEIGKCCRCNAALTDDRSRHYGIGPECETHWPWVIERVDEIEAEKARA